MDQLKKKFRPVHQLKILSDKRVYILETKLNSLSDKFKLITSSNNSNQLNKILFKTKKNLSWRTKVPSILNV